MNKEFIHKGGVDYKVYYKTNADAIHVIHKICGTLDSGSIDAEFEIPTPTAEARRNILGILGLNEDDWVFADEEFLDNRILFGDLQDDK